MTAKTASKAHTAQNGHVPTNRIKKHLAGVKATPRPRAASKATHGKKWLPKPMTAAQYEKWLNDLVDTIFRQAAHLDVTHEAMASASGCDIRTVRRIAAFETYLPRIRTVMVLARTVGLELTLVPTKIKTKGKETARPLTKGRVA